MTQNLPVSECFFSIQGEGPSLGCPSVFLRLKSCNLTCGGQRTVRSGALDSGATWRCDTIEVWTSGVKKGFYEIVEDWKKKGWIEHLRNGAHLIITGGEPLIHQEQIGSFLHFLKAQYRLPDLFVEVETNATLQPNSQLEYHISQYNVSPKLANSGMPRERRIIPSVLSWFAKEPKVFFKFVVSSMQDVLEVENDFVDPYSMAHHQVQLMPAASSRQELLETSLWVAEAAIQRGFRFSYRLHLALWDQAVGV